MEMCTTCGDVATCYVRDMESDNINRYCCNRHIFSCAIYTEILPIEMTEFETLRVELRHLRYAVWGHRYNFAILTLLILLGIVIGWFVTSGG